MIYYLKAENQSLGQERAKHMLVRHLVGLLVVLCLSACSTTRMLPAIDSYTISVRQETVEHSASDLQKQTIVKVMDINAEQAFKTTQMLYREQGQQINAYMNSRWSDAPDVLMGRYIQQFLQQSHYFRAVINERSQSQSDWLIESELIDFSHHIGKKGRSNVLIVMQFYLIDNKSKNMLATHYIESEVVVAEQNAAAAAVAFNSAANAVSQQLLNWLKQQSAD